MSDKITSCNKILDGATITQYDVAYEVTSGDLANYFCVTILASDMTDPTDENEVKTKANAKAKEIKDAWVANLPSETAQPVVSVEGDVTL